MYLGIFGDAADFRLSFCHALGLRDVFLPHESTKVWGGLCDVELVPALPGHSWTPLQASDCLLSLPVKRKIYLEVLVEDHYLLTVRLIHIYYFTENVVYSQRFLRLLNT